MKHLRHLSKFLPLLIIFLSFSASPPVVKIFIDDVSPYGDTNGIVEGHVTGVVYSDYRIFCIIMVEDVWWTKPTYASPLTEINEDGTFTIDITTGGNDRCATQVMVYLVPADYTPDLCSPCHVVPDIPEALGTDIVNRNPTLREITFSGYTWLVKSADVCRVGPGPNYFSDLEDDVYVNGGGELVLSIKYRDGKWFSTEVINTESLGYGTYTMVFNFRADLIDPNEIAAAFIWDTSAPEESYREIDFIEFAKWGIPSNSTNSQFVVHPCSACPGCGDNCTRFQTDLAPDDMLVTLFVVWQENEAHFRIYHGNWFASLPPAEELIYSWSKIGEVPEPGNENARFNFWLRNGLDPLDGLDREMVVKSFQHSPIIPVCGNGTIELGETCDDGNLIDGDGCSATCQSEYSFSIDGVSPYSTTDGWVWGSAIGYNPVEYGVAVYIKVRGGWWNKPYWNQPVSNISSGGSWTCDITTGGVDPEATEIRAYLIPLSYTPPNMSGGSTLPSSLEDNSIDWDIVIRAP